MRIENQLEERSTLNDLGTIRSRRGSFSEAMAGLLPEGVLDQNAKDKRFGQKHLIPNQLLT